LAKKPPNPSEPDGPDFEHAMQELEGVVGQLEEGDLGLDEALGRYEQAVRLLRRCYALLQRAERRIELLSGVDAEGNPITQPLDDEALSLEEKAERRARRRSASDAPDRPDRANFQDSENDIDAPDEPG